LRVMAASTGQHEAALRDDAFSPSAYLNSVLSGTGGGGGGEDRKDKDVSIMIHSVQAQFNTLTRECDEEAAAVGAGAMTVKASVFELQRKLTALRGSLRESRVRLRDVQKENYSLAKAGQDRYTSHYAANTSLEKLGVLDSLKSRLKGFCSALEGLTGLAGCVSSAENALSELRTARGSASTSDICTGLDCCVESVKNLNSFANKRVVPEKKLAEWTERVILARNEIYSDYLLPRLRTLLLSTHVEKELKSRHLEEIGRAFQSAANKEHEVDPTLDDLLTLVVDVRASARMSNLLVAVKESNFFQSISKMLEEEVALFSKLWEAAGEIIAKCKDETQVKAGLRVDETDLAVSVFVRVLQNEMSAIVASLEKREAQPESPVLILEDVLHANALLESTVAGSKEGGELVEVVQRLCVTSIIRCTSQWATDVAVKKLRSDTTLSDDDVSFEVFSERLRNSILEMSGSIGSLFDDEEVEQVVKKSARFGFDLFVRIFVLEAAEAQLCHFFDVLNGRMRRVMSSPDGASLLSMFQFYSSLCHPFSACTSSFAEVLDSNLTGCKDACEPTLKRLNRVVCESTSQHLGIPAFTAEVLAEEWSKEKGLYRGDIVSIRSLLSRMRKEGGGAPTTSLRDSINANLLLLHSSIISVGMSPCNPLLSKGGLSHLLDQRNQDDREGGGSHSKEVIVPPTVTALGEFIIGLPALLDSLLQTPIPPPLFGLDQVVKGTKYESVSLPNVGRGGGEERGEPPFAVFSKCTDEEDQERRNIEAFEKWIRAMMCILASTLVSAVEERGDKMDEHSCLSLLSSLEYIMSVVASLGSSGDEASAILRAIEVYCVQYLKRAAAKKGEEEKELLLSRLDAYTDLAENSDDACQATLSRLTSTKSQS